MFKSIGTVIVLIAISAMLNDAFKAFERATVQVFETVETAAAVSQTQLEHYAN